MRSKNAVKNATVNLIARILEQIIAFISRTIFIHFLSLEYLGITSLFSNVLSVLNLAELGIGTAINVALYKPLAEKNVIQVKSYMNFYKKAYRVIGGVILVVGLILIPFLPYLIKGSTDLVDINIAYIIFLAKSVFSYWCLAYKRTIMDADQKNYIVTIVQYLVSGGCKILQIFCLITLNSNPMRCFYIYCVIDMFASLITNLIISRIVDKKYSYLNDSNNITLSDQQKKELYKTVFGAAVYKISSTINVSADSIIISAFLGSVILGLYSNYLTIAIAVISIVSMIFNSITASIGNLNAIESEEKKREVFNSLHLAAFWMYGFCVICLWVLLNPFVSTLWLGSEYTLPELVVFALCMNYLVDGMMEAPVRFRNACGLYWQSRYRAIISVIVNVILSIIAVAVLHWDIPGILLATIISRIFVTLTIDTKIVHKYVLKMSPTRYFIKYFLSLATVIVTGGVTKIICNKLPDDQILFFWIRFLICLIIPNTLWMFLFHRMKEFVYLRDMTFSVLKKLHPQKIK